MTEILEHPCGCVWERRYFDPNGLFWAGIRLRACRAHRPNDQNYWGGLKWMRLEEIEDAEGEDWKAGG